MEAPIAYGYEDDGFGSGGVSPQEAAALASMSMEEYMGMDDMGSAHTVQLIVAVGKVGEMEAAGENVPERLKAYKVPFIGLTQEMKDKIFCAAVDALYEDFCQEQALKKRVARKVRKAAKKAEKAEKAEAKAKKAEAKAKKEAEAKAKKEDKKAEAKAKKKALKDIAAEAAMVVKVKKALAEMLAGACKDVLVWKLEDMTTMKWPVYSLVADTNPENVLVAILQQYNKFRDWKSMVMAVEGPM